jgi:mycofactocin glycosyltransferase
MTIAEPPAPWESLPPADLTVVVSLGVRIRSNGRVVIGGSPKRLIVLTEAGAQVLATWRKPAEAGAGSGRRRLARRLLDAGILAPRPSAAPDTSSLTVIVPVRDRVAELGRCLDAVVVACPGSPVIVVDDGSRAADAVRAVAEQRGAAVVRIPASVGAAAARNQGLTACRTPYVGFVDSDVVLPPAAARDLLGHLADPALGAVAPRVTALAPSLGIIAGYERRHSALDMGARGGLVRPGSALAYVPSAVLFVRRDAVGSGFDPAMRIGEDVDLIWRLTAAGWRVRYVAEIPVLHAHRERVGPFLAARHRYAESIGALARRHPEALPAVRVDPALAAPWLLLVGGRPRLAVAAAAWTLAQRPRRLSAHPAQSRALAVRTTARGLAASGVALARAIRRPWLPVVAGLAYRHPRARLTLAAAFAVPVIQDALEADRLGAFAGDVVIRLVDELLAAAGTWTGCLRAGTIRPLMPARSSSEPVPP